MHRLTRRQAIAGGAAALGSLALLGHRPVAAQAEPRPQFLMFHVEEGW